MADTKISPLVMTLFVKALLLAEKEGAPEITVDHLWRALDTPDTSRPEQPAGHFVPAPHCDKPLSLDAKSVIAKISAESGPEQITLDSLRAAFLAARQNR